MLPRQFSKVVNDKILADIKRRIEAGEKLKSIGEIYGCSGETIRQHALKLDCKAWKSGNSKLSPAQVREAKRKYEKEKCSMTEIAKLYGVTVENIGYIAKRDNWKLRARKRWILKSQLYEYQRLYEKRGWTFDLLGKLHGISGTAMRNWALKNNWKIRTVGDGKRASFKRKREEAGITQQQFDEYKAYHREVELLTRTNYKKYKHLLDPNSLRGKDFHLDHRLSRYDGFYKYSDKIPPEIIAHPANLKIRTQKENNKKSRRSSLTKAKLMRMIKKFDSIRTK